METALTMSEEFPLIYKRSSDYVKDPNVLSLIKEFEQRSIKGEQKYGCTTDRDDIDLLGWLQHLKEELQDACVYLTRVQKELKRDIG
jgi:hypothetical protein